MTTSCVNSTTTPNLFPSSEDIDPSWAIYRRLQLVLITGLHYIEKHGPQFDLEFEQIDHTVLDMEYCWVGVLAGAIATRDNFVADTFFLLRPDGELRQ